MSDERQARLREAALATEVTPCDHRDERGSTIMQADDDRYECVVCGQRFRLVSRTEARFPAQEEGLDFDSPRFRAAVDATFAAPGEFGPAKGYYGTATDHFIEMLRAAYRALGEPAG